MPRSVSVILLTLLLQLVSPSPELPQSSLTCVGLKATSRRCYFRDVLVVHGVIWFISDTIATIPPILCSSVDHDRETYCHILSMNASSASQKLNQVYGLHFNEIIEVETGLAFGRLNPTNVYHTLFEDTIPLYQILKQDALLTDWLELKPMLSSIVVFQDHRVLYPFDFSHTFWTRFFPNTIYVVRPHPDASYDSRFETSWKAYLVKYLVAGSNNSCAHYFHCTGGGYTDPKAVTEFREFLLDRVGVVPRDSRDRHVPNVLIVQRRTTRRIRNISQLKDTITRIHDNAPRVQDLEKLCFDDQIKLVHDADVVIMIHGGAVGHLLFMAPYSTLFEFYPYSWPFEFHGLVNWVRYSMYDVPIRHHAFDIRDPRHMVYRGRRLGLCTCNTSTRALWYTCGVRLYYLLGHFEVELNRFQQQYSIAHQQRETHRPIDPPMDRRTFKNFTLTMKEPEYYSYVRYLHSKTPAFKRNGSRIPNCFQMVYNLAI